MKNVIVDKNKILDLLKNQFFNIMNKNPNLYNGISLIIADEVQFTKITDRDDTALYIVVKFGSATFNFGQTTQNITMSVITEKNHIDLAQLLLMEFVTEYNLKLSENGTTLQAYTTPVITSNFNYVYDGFRSVLYVTGTFLISENTIRLSVVNNYTDENGVEKTEDIEAISNILGFSNQLDPQAFYRTHNFTESVAKVATLTFSLTMFLVSDLDLLDKTISLMFKEKGINTPFNLTLNLGRHTITDNFRLSTAQINQDATSLPTITMTFTN